MKATHKKLEINLHNNSMIINGTFDYIRASEVFAYAKEQEYQAVKIYLEET